MKRLISVLFLISLGFGQQIIPQITETYENGNIKSITYHKKIGNGLHKVKEEGYYKGGLQIYEYNYYDGVKDGLQTEWFNNGQKKYEGTYEDGRHVGSVTMWYENGQKKEEKTLNKNGKIVGLWTDWYKNGQKKTEITFKDGTPVGLVTMWYENGQKEVEEIIKDSKVISSKEWNEDGSIKENSLLKND